MILLRTINDRLSAEEQFIINPLNNLLEYHFKINWKDYKNKIPKIQSLKRFFIYLCNKLRKFQEIIYFVEPSSVNIMSSSLNNNSNIEPESQERIHLYDDYIKIINNYRNIIRNTKNMRLLNNQYYNRLMQLKQYKPQNQFQQFQINQQKIQIQVFFQHNINILYQQSLGLQKCSQNIQIYQKCINNIKYHQNTKDKNNVIGKGNQNDSNNFGDSQNKIVHGIDVVKKDKEKILSKQGAHSQITRGMFLFRIIKTIDCDVAKNQTKKWIVGTQKKTQLTVKRCNYTVQASKNSFLNQLYFLNYIRDYHSSFIGKYYLQMKNLRDRNQKDPIYMKSYYQNVDYIVMKCHTLSIKDRLSLIYRISLGLCFLSAKNILHRDFKPHNIVVNNCLTPHIIDFGSCCSVYGSNTFVPYDKRLLTTRYIHVYYHQIPQQYHYIYQKMSKDQYQQHPLFDIYSFGKMISFIMFGRFQPPHFQLIQLQPYADLLKNLLFLISMCLNIDPDDRPGIGQVTGFLGSLSKYYSCYQDYFLQKVSEPIISLKDKKSNTKSSDKQEDERRQTQSKSRSNQKFENQKNN